MRILIDKHDLLANGSLGIDPVSFFQQTNLFGYGSLLIGRCLCGVEGCCDEWVTVNQDDMYVFWDGLDGRTFQFNRVDCVNTLKAAMNDHSWENVNRSAERLVEGIFRGSGTPEGYLFNWASARIKLGAMTLSWMKGDEQQLMEFPWDGNSPEDARQAAQIFRASQNWISIP